MTRVTDVAPVDVELVYEKETKSRVRFKEPETDLLGVVYMSRTMFKHMSYPRRIMVRVTALQLRPGPNPTEEDTKA